MVSELTVIVKDSEKTLRTKHLVYDNYSICDDDPFIRNCVEQTVKEFGATPDSIKVKISLTIE